MMIAALPMYDFPELWEETNAIWHNLRGHFASAGISNLPMHLTRAEDPYDLWLSSDLIFSQTCGFPLTHRLKDKVRYVATPCFDAPGCENESYRSYIIIRENDPAIKGTDLVGRTAAINSVDSQSGFNVLSYYLAKQGIKNSLIREAFVSGAHRQSIKMVRNRLADFCAIDCVSWALLKSIAAEEVAGLRVLDQTATAPCLPYITSLERPVEDVAALRSGLAAMFNDTTMIETHRKLLLKGFAVLNQDHYDVILEQELSARYLG